MVGYGPPLTSAAMDIDNENARSKYASHHAQQQYPPAGSTSSKPYDSRGSRSSRGPREEPDDGHRSGRSSARTSSRGGGTSSRPTRYAPQQHQQGVAGVAGSSHPSASSQYQSRPGPTNAPASSMTSNTPSHFTPPQGHYGRSVAPTTPEMQPTYPPPAVTSESPQPSEQSQRRPAYLLHRDLVIGKGSYGQVCIASRGEAEGHSSGKGKRKKFACKCVMLRNDPKYISKLQEEVNVLRELRGHDNVIRLYDVFCVDNELFIITELGRGGDLFHLLTTHPKHGVTEAYAGK